MNNCSYAYTDNGRRTYLYMRDAENAIKYKETNTYIDIYITHSQFNIYVYFLNIIII